MFKVYTKVDGSKSIEKCSEGVSVSTVVYLRQLHCTHLSNSDFKRLICFLSGESWLHTTVHTCYYPLITCDHVLSVVKSSVIGLGNTRIISVLQVYLKHVDPITPIYTFLWCGYGELKKLWCGHKLHADHLAFNSTGENPSYCILEFSLVEEKGIWSPPLTNCC